MRPFVSIVVLALLASAAFAHPHHGDRPSGAPEVSTHAAPSERPYGRAGEAAKASRTISLEMSDAGRCSPSAFSVKRGETVKIVARNPGTQPKELAIGTSSELKEHAQMLRKHPQMQGMHAQRAAARPGGTAQLVWQFAQPGEFSVSCAPSGVYAPGDLAKVTVTP